MDIEVLLAAPESETIECKEAWSDECLRALAALANTRGGTLLVGVSDDRRSFPGWQGDGKEQERVSNQIVSLLLIHPAALTVEMHAGTPILAVEVAGAASPVALRGRYYRRVGNSTREVPAEELPRFLLERARIKWDSLPCEQSIEALDAAAVEDFKVLARNRLSALRPTDEVGTVIDNLQLRDEQGRLTRAAVLLFGKDREAQRVCLSAFLQIGRFQAGAVILDEKQITGNLFTQLDAAMEQLRAYLQVRYEFPEPGEDDRQGLAALQRREVWEYPRAALREAVANALLHRDYTDSGRVMIRVYDDHILISSPGLLPEGVTVADLSHDPHRSKLRNPLLAQAFFFAEIVERWGTGTTRMARLCSEQGLPAPEFAEVSGEVWVTFRKDPYSEQRLRALGLSERQIRAVIYVQEKGRISNAEYRGMVAVSDRTAARDLEALAAEGVFKRVGAGRQAHYVLAGAKPAKPASNPP